MKTLINRAVAGAIAAGLMVLLKLLLSQQAALHAWHYPAFELAGQDGLRRLAEYAVWGAGYALLWDLLLKALLPSGLLLGPLALGAVPTLVAALVMPLYYGGAALKEPWTLLWLYAHWSLWALFFLFIGGKGGAKKKAAAEE